ERAMDPEPIAAGFVAADHRRLLRDAKPSAGVRDRSSHAAEITRRHCRHPWLDAESGRQRQLPLFRTHLERYVQRRLAYTERRAGRCSSHLCLLLAWNSIRSLPARPALIVSLWFKKTP